MWKYLNGIEAKVRRMLCLLFCVVFLRHFSMRDFQEPKDELLERLKICFSEMFLKRFDGSELLLMKDWFRICLLGDLLCSYWWMSKVFLMLSKLVLYYWRRFHCACLKVQNFTIFGWFWILTVNWQWLFKNESSDTK